MSSLALKKDNTFCADASMKQSAGPCGTSRPLTTRSASTLTSMELPQTSHATFAATGTGAMWTYSQPRTPCSFPLVKACASRWSKYRYWACILLDQYVRELAPQILWMRPSADSFTVCPCSYCWRNRTCTCEHVKSSTCNKIPLSYSFFYLVFGRSVFLHFQMFLSVFVLFSSICA